MKCSLLKRLVCVGLMWAVAGPAWAAKVPDERSDLLRFLDGLWGKPVANFAKAAKLKPADLTVVTAPRAEQQILALGEPVRALWTPKSLAAALRTAEFDPKLGLVAVNGTLAGTPADFDALVKEMNTRYGPYATRTSALEVNTYGWVFPNATLSLSSTEGAPTGFRIQVNP